MHDEYFYTFICNAKVVALRPVSAAANLTSPSSLRHSSIATTASMALHPDLTTIFR